MQKEIYSKYKNEVPATFGRRAEASLIDSLIIVVLSFLLIIGGVEILGITPFYQTWNNNLNEARIACYKIEEEAKLYEFTDNEDGQYLNLVQPEDTFEDYALRQILVVYEKDKENFLALTNQTEILNPKGLTPASYETDNLAYFFSTYVPDHNNYQGIEYDLIDMKGKSGPEFYYQILNDNAVDTTMYVLDYENYSLPYLKTEFAANLYRYLFLDQSNFQVGLTSYNLLAKNYQNMWNLAVDELIDSSRYQEHYQIYMENYAYSSYGVDVVCVLAYFISFLAAFVLPNIIFKTSTSWGKYLLKMSAVRNDSENPTFLNYLLKHLVNFFSYAPLLLISCFFGGGLDTGWMYPIFEIGEVGFSLFNITAILLVLPIVSVILLLARSKKQSLSDLASSLTIVDIRYYVDPEEFTEEKKKEIEEKDKDKIVNVEKTYFDSSCFNSKEDENKES